MVKIKNLNKPIWLKYTENEVKDIIIAIAKKNPELTSEKIGLILRDTYGIPKTKIYNIKIGKVLKERGLYTNADVKNLKEKIRKLEEHSSKNALDQKAKRATIITKAKLKKREEYNSKKKE